jgi:hypothetical protein
VQIEELTALPASISVLEFEAISKNGATVAPTIERENVSLSVETKVAIAVATGFVLMVVGAMAQG